MKKSKLTMKQILCDHVFEPYKTYPGRKIWFIQLKPTVYSVCKKCWFLKRESLVNGKEGNKIE
jgi:hypothetical protein